MLNFLPTGGVNTPLTIDHADPILPFGGLISGELVALRLNADFGAAGLIGGTFRLGDLYLCGLISPAAFNGSTVTGFAATANTLLAGGSVSGVTLDQAQELAAELNAAFLGGVPSSFAGMHLSPTSCP